MVDTAGAVVAEEDGVPVEDMEVAEEEVVAMVAEAEDMGEVVVDTAEVVELVGTAEGAAAAAEGMEIPVAEANLPIRDRT